MKRILSTHSYGQYPAWASRVDSIARQSMPPGKLFRELIRRAGNYDAMILNGSIGIAERFVDLLAAMTIRRTRSRPPAIILTDCSWKLGDLLLDRVAMRAGAAVLDGPRIRFCVVSTMEAQLFPRRWGVKPEHVLFTPGGNRLTEEEHLLGTSTTGGVFAGGNSLRDYATLLDAVRDLDVPVQILTGNVINTKGKLPPNVHVGPIRSHQHFLDGLRNAAVVVTPLQKTAQRAAGVDTYLSAMALGKLAIVSDGPATRDYIEPGRTGLIVPAGQWTPLRNAIRWALDPANAIEVAAIGRRAEEAAWGRFSFESYVHSLLNAVDGVLK